MFAVVTAGLTQPRLCVTLAGATLREDEDAAKNLRFRRYQTLSHVGQDFAEGFGTLQRDRGRFAVPSLRNVAVTAPCMHDGRFPTLEEGCNIIAPA
jgi:cytochrome c peroxidase